MGSGKGFGLSGLLFDPAEHDSGSGGVLGGDPPPEGADPEEVQSDPPDQPDPSEKLPDNSLAEFLDDDGNLTVTVNGEERTLGPSELKAELQKGLAGDARLREAAKAESRIAYADDLEAAMDDDVDAYYRVAEARGISEEDATEILEYYESQTEDNTEKREMAQQAQQAQQAQAKQAREADVVDRAEENSPPSPQVKYVERQRSEDEKKTMEWAHAKQLQEVREWIHGELDKGLDTDPRFAILMRSGGKCAGKVRELARDAVRRIVVSEQVEYSPTVQGRVLDELDGILKTFGALGNTSLPPGAGRAPGGGAPQLMQVQEPRAKRPDPDSPDYEKWVTGELANLQAEAILVDE